MVLPSSQQGTPTEVSQGCISASKKHVDPTLYSFSNPQPNSLPDGFSQLTQYFSQDALRTAETVGVLTYLRDLTAMYEAPDTALVRILLRRQQLHDHIILAVLEIESATAEIICERDRADQLADRIDEVDGARVKQLTIASIIIGGLTGIVTGAAGLAIAGTIADASSIGGGALSAWLGLSALWTHSEVDLQHDRNILQEVWEHPDHPQILSPLLWRYLDRRSDGEQGSPRKELVNAWGQKGRLGAPDSDDERHRRDLFFSRGGRYTASELRARASMLETLEATLRLLHEELEVLTRESTSFAVRLDHALGTL
jgi:hypothetical protein